MLARENAIRQMQNVGRYMMERELTWGNAGNISTRLTEDTFLITASGTYLGELGADDFVEWNFLQNTGAPVGRKPSKEWPIHRAVYEVRPEIGAVVHGSPFFSTLIACSGLDIPNNWFLEEMYYLERIERVPYAHPGSPELERGVREKMAKANVLLLENHGVLVYDTNLKEAQTALHTLEIGAKMLIWSRNAGIPPKELSREKVQDFLENSGYKPRREWGE